MGGKEEELEDLQATLDERNRVFQDLLTAATAATPSTTS